MSITELLDLTRRLPPWNISQHVESIVNVLGGPSNDVADELLSSTDQPLKVLTDATGREFLACDFNRDSAEDDDENGGDAHRCGEARPTRQGIANARCFRSPWSNEYIPAIPDGTKPSARLRVLEQAANDAFSVYREMYYEGTGISSVYLWDLEEGSNTFAGVVLLKKTTREADGQTTGAWDSIHVFEASEKSRQGIYKLTSTVSAFPLA